MRLYSALFDFLLVGWAGSCFVLLNSVLYCSTLLGFVLLSCMVSEVFCWAMFSQSRQVATDTPQTVLNSFFFCISFC